MHVRGCPQCAVAAPTHVTKSGTTAMQGEAQAEAAQAETARELRVRVVG
jgi:hypothetical protein